MAFITQTHTGFHAPFQGVSSHLADLVRSGIARISSKSRTLPGIEDLSTEQLHDIGLTHGDVARASLSVFSQSGAMELEDLRAMRCGNW